MSSIKAVLIPNTSATGSTKEFTEAQSEMKDPMVLFINKDTNEYIEPFEIVARDLEELRLMFEMKIFYTSSIPRGKSERKYGAIFYGVDKNRHKKTHPAATERAIG